ncbi:MAG: prepilin peptidase [Deltaproteobacteria bacterium]|nr:prepilin peptidase [Deltaproteobacteria bacterium]
MLPPAFEVLFTAALVVLGLVVGSFLNVVIWRVPRGESIVHPGSHCPRCGSPIAGFDNIPVFAWLLLGGRCRVCRGPISWRYPLVEALTGVVTFLFIQHDGFEPILAFHLVFAWAGIALALIDLDTFLLPLVITLPLIPITLASGLLDGRQGILRAVLGAGIGWSLIVIVGKIGELIAGQEAMGGGDAWLMASIGAMTGPLKLVVALFFASIQGAILGMILLRIRRQEEAELPQPEPPKPEAPAEPGVEPRAEPKPEARSDDEEEDWVPPPTAVPFGPFLVLGALQALLWGDWVLHWLRLDQLRLWG